MKWILSVPVTITLVVLLVTAYSTNASSEQATSLQDKTLRIRSAKRTVKFDDGFTELTVHDSTKEVILVLELTGISVADFNSTTASEVFLIAEDRRFEPSFQVGADWEQPDAAGFKDDRWVVVIIPRSTLTFSLHYPKHEPMAFKAETAIISSFPSR